jgi:hypothetical protein
MPTKAAPRDVGCEDSLKTIKRWLDECDQEHACLRPDLKEMPTRLLQCSATTDPGFVRLVSTQGLHALNVRYTALSYCWGGKTQVRTLKANADQHKQGIRLDTLPRTIQDAVSVTRRLGLEYLWVDSLCNIQDSREDLEREIANMANIYSNSYLTISAASAPDCETSFLQPRSGWTEAGLPQIRIPFRCPDPDSRIGGVDLHHQNCFQRSFFDMEERLHTRGWTFQEHLLAPRLLVFSALQVFWRCCNTHTCYKPEGKGADATAYFQNLGLLSLRRRIASSAKPGSHESLWTPSQNTLRNMWFDIVEDYSKRNLSCGQDKLLALSGIASEVHKMGEKAMGSYLAGAWSRTLINDLLWSSCEPNTRRIRAPGVHFPSWSWACVDAPVRRWGSSKSTPWQTFDEQAKILSSRVDPIYDFAPFGNVKEKASEIRISASIVTKLYNVKTMEFSGHRWEGESSRLPSYPDIGRIILDSTDDMVAETSTTLFDGIRSILCLHLVTVSAVFLPPDVIMYQSDKSHKLAQDPLALGLVIKPVKEKCNVYSRIGFFSSFPGFAKTFESHEEEIVLV